MATHSSISAGTVPWTEEPGGLQSMGSQRVGHNSATNTQTHRHTHTHTLEESDFPGQTYKFLSFRLFIVNLLKCQFHGKSQRAVFVVYNFIFRLSWVFVALPGFLQLLQ